MSSNINELIPPLGAATTSGVRANFLAAKNEITALQDATGFANFHDTATAITPINLPSNIWVDLTNNKLGTLTLNKLPGGIDLWNSTTNRFAFTSLPLFSQLAIRADVVVTTGGNNMDVDIRAIVAIGSASQYLFPLMTQMRFATAGTHQITTFNGMYLGSNDVRNFPMSLQIKTSGTATVVVNGWYVSVQTPTFT